MAETIHALPLVLSIRYCDLCQVFKDTKACDPMVSACKTIDTVVDVFFMIFGSPNPGFFWKSLLDIELITPWSSTHETLHLTCATHNQENLW